MDRVNRNVFVLSGGIVSGGQYFLSCRTLLNMELRPYLECFSHVLLGNAQLLYYFIIVMVDTAHNIC